MKKILHFIVIFALLIGSGSLYAQQLFSVSNNNLSKEIITQLKTQAEKSEISVSSLTKINENRDVYRIAFSGVQNTEIIILNEQTGAHVVLTPVKESLAELQLAPFFIEELKQGVLGEANRYLVVETTPDYSVKSVSSVSCSNGNVPLPRYFFGKKENVKEALPRDRQIIGIFKAKPRLIPAFPNDPENLRYVAQLAEKKSYYIYLFKLPDGTICTYDEHLYSENIMNEGRADGPLEFNLSGNTTGEVRAATQYAFSLWSNKLAGKVPIDIKVDSKPMDPGVLGGSYITSSFLQTSTNTFFISSLWNQIVGYDATPMLDIRIEMNSNFTWYYGTDGNTPYSKYDYVTTMLHELNHGLGFSDNIDGEDEPGCFWYYNQNGEGFYTEYPNIFMRQLFQGASGPCITELNQSQRAALIVSGNLYSGRPGSKLLAANGGSRVKMYAPYPYNSGSSVCHWDTYVSFETFMLYSGGPGESYHIIGTREMGMLLDMGWTENGATGDCPGVSNMNVQYAADCNSVQISWKAPSKDNMSGSGGADCQVRFEKEKAYQTATKMAVWDSNNNSLASHDFGSNAGISPYYTIPPGSHAPGIYLTTDGKWYYLLANPPYTYNFQSGHKYTVVCSDDGTYLVGYVKDDGGGGDDTKYNIYRDGALIKGNHDQTSYTDSGFNPNTSHKWEVKVVCAGGGESPSASVTKASCLVGVDENVENTITIYPNPTTGELRIENGELKIENVEIFDVLGKKQNSRKAEQQNIVIDISDLSNGVYFLKISTEQGIVTKKIVKN